MEADMDRIVREAECKRLTGLSRTTRWELERRGQFPSRRRLGSHSVGWLASELEAWVAGREQRPVGQPVAAGDSQSEYRGVERRRIPTQATATAPRPQLAGRTR